MKKIFLHLETIKGAISEFEYVNENGTPYLCVEFVNIYFNISKEKNSPNNIEISISKKRIHQKGWKKLSVFGMKGYTSIRRKKITMVMYPSAYSYPLKNGFDDNKLYYKIDSLKKTD